MTWLVVFLFFRRCDLGDGDRYKINVGGADGEVIFLMLMMQLIVTADIGVLTVV